MCVCVYKITNYMYNTWNSETQYLNELFGNLLMKNDLNVSGNRMKSLRNKFICS